QLPVGGAFTDFVALEQPWVVVSLVAVPEFSLTPHRWCYPIVGCQAYRAYFSLKPARKEQRKFQARGYDTFIGGVTAYSTLGWFDDPLHTGFTNLPEDRMVALMFHELAHRVVYLNGDTAFNESFATAVELEGLKLWLEKQQAPGGFERALQRLEHRNRTYELVQATSEALKILYQQKDQMPREQLRQRKHELLDELARNYESLSQHYSEPGPFGHAPVQLNNANLALFQQYNQHVPAFRQLLRESGHDFNRFYESVIELAEQPQTSRQHALDALSQRFDEHLRVAPGAMGRQFGAGQILHCRGLEAPLPEPGFGLGGQHKQFANALPTGQLLDHHQNVVTTACPPVGRVHGKAGQLSGALLGIVIEGCTANDGAIPFGNHKAVDFGFQHLPRATHQHALLFQRLDQLQNTADVFNPRRPNLFVMISADQRTRAVPGEQLFQQRAVFGIADDMSTAHALHAGITGGLEQGRIVTGHGVVIQPLGRLTGRQLADQRAVFVQQAFIVNEHNELFGLQGGSNLAANIFIGKIEGISGR